LERDVLPVRVREYRPQLLDQLISMGEVVWTGRGSLGSSDGRVALYLRSDGPRLIREPEERPSGEIHERLRDHLQSRGASFFRDLYYATGSTDEDAVLDALWDMVWAGEVTNDTFLPLRMLGPRMRRNPRRPLMRLGPPAAAGRWSLVGDLLRPQLSTTEHLHAVAGVLLQRYGVLTREAALGESISGGIAARIGKLEIQSIDGHAIKGSHLEGMLRQAGFGTTPKGVVLWPERRPVHA